MKPWVIHSFLTFDFVDRARPFIRKLLSSTLLLFSLFVDFIQFVILGNLPILDLGHCLESNFFKVLEIHVSMVPQSSQHLHVVGNLALSRALGDFCFKKNDKKPPEEQIVTGIINNFFYFANKDVSY